MVDVTNKDDQKHQDHLLIRCFVVMYTYPVYMSTQHGAVSISHLDMIVSLGHMSLTGLGEHHRLSSQMVQTCFDSSHRLRLNRKWHEQVVVKTLRSYYIQDLQADQHSLLSSKCHVIIMPCTQSYLILSL